MLFTFTITLFDFKLPNPEPCYAAGVIFYVFYFFLWHSCCWLFVESNLLIFSLRFLFSPLVLQALALTVISFAI